jgi:transcriptional regulator with XRE-family HTH domain
MGRRLEPQEALGQAIRELRGQRGLTQRQLADAADVNETWISHIEAGRTNPACGTVVRIAGALGVPVSALALRGERLSDGPSAHDDAEASG